MSKKVRINGVLTLCQSGRGGATKDDIMKELDRRGLKYNKNALKGELCKILAADDKRGVIPTIKKSQEKDSLMFSPELKSKLNNRFNSVEQLLINSLDDHKYIDVGSKTITKEVKSNISLNGYDFLYSEVIPGNRILEVYRISQFARHKLFELVQAGKGEKVIGKIAIFDVNEGKYIAETSAYLKREWEDENERWWDETITAAVYIGNNQVLYLTSVMHGQIIWDFSKNTLTRVRTADDMDTRSVIIHPLNPRVLMYIKLSNIIFVYLDETEQSEKKKILLTKTKKIKYKDESGVGDHLFKISGDRVLYVETGIGMFKFPNKNNITEFKYTEILGIWEGRGDFGPEVTSAGMIKKLNNDDFNGVYEITSNIFLLKTMKRYMFLLHLNEIINTPEKDRKLIPVASSEGYSEAKDAKYLVANLPQQHLIAWYHPYFFLDKIKNHVIFIPYKELLRIESHEKGVYVDIKQIEGSVLLPRYVADIQTISDPIPFREAITIVENYMIKNSYLAKNLTNIIRKFLY